MCCPGELAAALFGKLQEHSSSGAVDLATVVDCFSGERLRDRPRLEAPVRGVWVSTLHCRRLFAVLDANRSGVAHREAFEAVFRCCCGPVTRQAEAREADLCARVGVRAGVLRACVEDALYGAGKESDIPNFKGSSLGRFPLVSADFWTSDHLSERSRSVDAFSGTRARGTLALQRR